MGLNAVTEQCRISVDVAGVSMTIGVASFDLNELLIQVYQVLPREYKATAKVSNFTGGKVRMFF